MKSQFADSNNLNMCRTSSFSNSFSNLSSIKSMMKTTKPLDFWMNENSLYIQILYVCAKYTSPVKICIILSVYL